MFDIGKCKNCHIFNDKACDECVNYETCIDNGMDFVTLDNAPESFPECFDCNCSSAELCILNSLINFS